MGGKLPLAFSSQVHPSFGKNILLREFRIADNELLVD